MTAYRTNDPVGYVGDDPIRHAVTELLETAAHLWAQFAPMVEVDGEWIPQTEITSSVGKPFLHMAEAAWDRECGR